MNMLKALKIRLYPNKTQEEQINKLLGCYRFVYNKCLNKKINSYKESGITENRTTLGHYIHHDLLKDDEFVWLREQNTKVLKQAVIDMLSAYEHFFKQYGGYPKFKSKNDNKQSCRFELGAISKRNIYTNYKISLANIRNINFRCSDNYAEYLEKNKEKIKSATLSKLPCGEYYLSILIDGDLLKRVQQSQNTVGIDLGIKDFVITSNGEVFENQHFKKSLSNRLKKLQRQLSRKQKGSNNRNKARIKLAKLNKKINDKKLNYLHEVSNALINENQVICIEDLNIKGMVKNHRLAESISEMNWGEFRKMLEYKADWYGRIIVKVDRFYPSSKTCNHCGYIKKDLKLSDRQWVCPECGEVIDRDYNAACNIKDEGIRILVGGSTTEFTLVENPTVDERKETFLKSSDSLKQENHNERFVQVWLYCEASGSVEKMFKKNGGIAIPNTYAEMMIGGVRVLDEDGFHYERMIGNDMENKMIFGFNDIETFELIKKEHEGYILRCIEKIHQLYPNGRVDLISESDGDEPGVKNYLVCAKETVNVFVRMWYEWGTHEFSEKSLKILKKNLNIIQTAIEKNIIPNGFSHSFERAFAYGNEVASSSTILQFHKFQ